MVQESPKKGLFPSGISIGVLKYLKYIIENYTNNNNKNKNIAHMMSVGGKTPPTKFCW